jgi:Uma2 family endonuclease
MIPVERALVTEDEYIERERRSETKNELINGVIVAMAGASPKHNAIAANVIGVLRASLKGGPCSVLTSDQRIHISETGLYTDPDASVVCGKPQFHPKFPDTLLNPKVVVEVLSSSTQDYDRGAKFAHYRTLRSLTEYLLVAQEGKQVEHYHRLPTKQWLLTEYKGDEDKVTLPTLDVELPLAEIYDNVERFEPEQGAASEGSA